MTPSQKSVKSVVKELFVPFPPSSLPPSPSTKQFACFLPPPTCTRTFHTPKARRLHLIQTHGYPKQYFFAVTNKGIGGLLRKWGEGASLLRGEWKAREEDDGREREMTVVVDEDEEDTTTATTTPRARTSHVHQLESQSSSASAAIDTTMEDLTTNLRSISLVPDKIRFGRGGSKKTITRGFVPLSSHREAAGNIGKRPPNHNHNHIPNPTTRGHGRGSGGRNLVGHDEDHAPPTTEMAGVTPTTTAPKNFVTVNSRGRGRGKIWVPNV